jgi:hypothetical protein
VHGVRTLGQTQPSIIRGSAVATAATPAVDTAVDAVTSVRRTAGAVAVDLAVRFAVASTVDLAVRIALATSLQ